MNEERFDKGRDRSVGRRVEGERIRGAFTVSKTRENDDNMCALWGASRGLQAPFFVARSFFSSFCATDLQ